MGTAVEAQYHKPKNLHSPVLAQACTAETWEGLEEKERKKKKRFRPISYIC